ncbi:replicative DNA helicase [Longimicrobium sp.]|uniref:replicative DNA helicase n=1 Tax=Longimicrobium sp. TaxID=2029185 RepID=UPI002C455BCE|nr:replicative DNA helicase [Longimicrobium sp.]HSU13624.1 replicative DNA helicase [Longimicrobium sp.]
MSTPAFKIAPPPPGPSAFTDRTPPYSAEAEMAVLGGMLIDQDAVVRAVELVDDSMFHREANRRLFRSLVRIWQRGDVIDEITVTDDLKKAGDYEAVGGVAFLASLLDAVPTAANIEYHCKIVREKAILRRLIEASTSIIQETYAWQGEVENLMDLAESRIFQLAQSSDRRGFVWIKEILWPTFEKIEQLQANQSAITGVPSGFHDLDELTAGFQSSDLVIVAARPSMGKCLAFDSEIVLDDGSIATIEELYRRRSARLLTLNDGWKLEMTEPSAFVDDGEKPVFRVTTRLGRQIETTLTHPFLTIDGWKRLEEIRAGQHVAVPRRIGVFGSREMRECEVKLLAYLIGDGGLTRAAPRLARASAAVRADFAKAVDDLADAPVPAGVGAIYAESAGVLLTMETGRGKTCSFAALASSVRNRNGDSACWDQLANLVLHEVEQDEAHVPAPVFELNRESIALLLNRLFSLHAYGVASPDGPAVVFRSPSERLSRQVQHLLLRFGILSARARWDDWQVMISNPHSLRLFASEVGVFGHQQDLAEFAAAADARPVAARSSDTPASDVYWDEVVAIEPVGVKQVYDLTVPGTHNFVANDVCVHNTAFTLNIAQHAAISAQKPVAFFSLEMSKESLVQRVLCAEARVDASRLRRGRLTDDDYARLAIAAGHLNTAPIYIDDTPGISVLEMRAKARRLKSDRDDLSMIIVDYLQLMVGAGKTESRQQEVSEISRGLKALAKELNIPVIALSQLSRAVESRPDKRPMMSDLRESGAIEQDADVIMFLYRPEYYFGPVDKEGNSLEGKAELIIGKQRNGATGSVPLFFRKEFTLFESMSSARSED